MSLLKLDTERPSPTELVMELVSKVRRTIQGFMYKLLIALCAAHESPYLNQGNVKSLLKTGMTFTSEPGIYLVDKFGVRHEDVLLVQGDEEPVLLTGTRAVGPWDP